MRQYLTANVTLEAKFSNICPVFLTLRCVNFAEKYLGSISRVIFAEKYSWSNFPTAEKILAAKARLYEFSSNFPDRQMCPQQIRQST
jgi:hypothetical protein